MKAANAIKPSPEELGQPSRPVRSVPEGRGSLLTGTNPEGRKRAKKTAAHHLRRGRAAVLCW